MRIGNIEAHPGEHACGYLEVPRSRSGPSPDIPVHLFAGAEPGPTLLVQGAIHGMVDFHAGGRTAYERYVNFLVDKDPDNLTESEKKRRKLVVANEAAVLEYAREEAGRSFERMNVSPYLDHGSGFWQGWREAIAQNQRASIVEREQS